MTNGRTWNAGQAGQAGQAPRAVRCDVASVEALRHLLDAPLPCGLRAERVERVFHRDEFVDTADARLRSRGVTCRFRTRSDDRRWLTVTVREPSRPDEGTESGTQRYEAEVAEIDALGAVRGNSEPARRLRAIVDPAQLELILTLLTERHLRRSRRRWLQRAQFEFVYDIATVEHARLQRTYQEVKVRRLHEGSPSLARVARALQEEYGLKPTLVDEIERARQLAAGMEREATRRATASGASIALVILDRGRIACHAGDGELRLPIAVGSGEGAARYLLVQTMGSGVGELRLLGVIPAAASRPALEVWRVAHPRRGREPMDEHRDLEWLQMEDLTSRVGTMALSDAPTIAALLLFARTETVSGHASPPPVEGVVDQRGAVRDAARADRYPPADAVDPLATTGEGGALNDEDLVSDTGHLLDSERSLLEFDVRVLAMAEDPRTPLLERLHYLAIVSSNLDEFFMVRVSALKRLALKPASGNDERVARKTQDRTPEDRLLAVRAHVLSLMARQERCLEACLREVASRGVRLLKWSELHPEAQLRMRRHFRTSIMPAMTPQAMTEAPGFPTPHVSAFTLSLLVVVKDPQTGPVHLAYTRIPPTIPRFIVVHETEVGKGEREPSGLLLPVEEIIRSEVDLLYPGRDVLQVYLFRVTRAGEIDVNEADSGNLLQAVEEDAKRRGSNPVVRVEAEPAMPRWLLNGLLDELRLDAGSEPLALGVADVYESASLIDLGALRELPALLPAMPDLFYPPFQPRTPFPTDRSVFELVRDQEQLIHHPYDDFSATVLRFLEEAAADPAVMSIKLTLYRAGERSPIVDALLRAAAAGKEVVAFVELKARFDEERNVLWARRLASAGVHVVYGLVGLKNHAKMALVTRLEQGVIRRYVHIGTGNYHAATARQYTDLGLFSADETLSADVSDLFNELTGSPRWPRATHRRLLVAPNELLPALVARIEREASHARAGRPARIRLKMNGLSDEELIAALYRASQAGVAIDLVVRGLCRLRPGVPNLSERIRVVSVLGRFLEHARIYYFENAGDPEYFIGSADWRVRNVRRRVEVVAPVTEAAGRAYLDLVLERDLADPGAWRLGADGTYTRASSPPDPGSSAQLAFLADAESRDVILGPALRNASDEGSVSDESVILRSAATKDLSAIRRDPSSLRSSG